MKCKQGNQSIFYDDLLIGLEPDGLLLGVVSMQVYKHMWANLAIKMDKNQEILKTKELLKVEYNPDWFVQHY